MNKEQHKIKFISYDGAYPALCMGILKVEIDGKIVEFPSYVLVSGGSATIEENGSTKITEGMWSLDLPKEYEPLEEELTELVNENVEFGCCGGCI